MRTRNEIEKNYAVWSENRSEFPEIVTAQVTTQILEVLLDIRDLLKTPPKEINDSEKVSYETEFEVGGAMKSKNSTQ